MDRHSWRALDSGLLGLIGSSLIALLVVRFVWVGSYLPDALRVFEHSDASLPRLTRLTLSSFLFYGAAGLTVVLATAGLALRSRGSKTVARTVLLMGALSGFCGAGLDAAGVWAALRATSGATRAGPTAPCPCTDRFACAGACTCVCNAAGWIVQQTLFGSGGGVATHVVLEHDAEGAVTAFTIDGDGDGRPDRRCVYDRPCPRGGARVACQMRCEVP